MYLYLYLVNDSMYDKLTCNTILFLFCPTQLSACRARCFAPKELHDKKSCRRLTTVFDPFPQSTASSMR